MDNFMINWTFTKENWQANVCLTLRGIIEIDARNHTRSQTAKTIIDYHNEFEQAP